MSQGEDEVSDLEDRMTELEQSDTKKKMRIFPMGISTQTVHPEKT